MENLSMKELFHLHRSGVHLQVRSVADLHLNKLDIRQPSDLVANSPSLQWIAEKHWKRMIAPKLRKK